MHVRLSLKLASNKNAKADARKLRDIHCMQTSFAGSLFTRREAEEREPVKFWFTESFSFLFFSYSVRQLHREFLRAGADVMQTFTFYASDDKLENRGNTASEKIGVRTSHIALLSKNGNYC